LRNLDSWYADTSGSLRLSYNISLRAETVIPGRHEVPLDSLREDPNVPPGGTSRAFSSLYGLDAVSLAISLQWPVICEQWSTEPP
jgi:hypothetical protein